MRFEVSPPFEACLEISTGFIRTVSTSATTFMRPLSTFMLLIPSRRPWQTKPLFAPPSPPPIYNAQGGGNPSGDWSCEEQHRVRRAYLSTRFRPCEDTATVVLHSECVRVFLIFTQGVLCFSVAVPTYARVLVLVQGRLPGTIHSVRPSVLVCCAGLYV